MTAQQLAIVPPGYCPRCTVTRLSVADVEFCLYCTEEQDKRTAKRGLCRQCNSPAMIGRGLCLPCQNVRNVENKHKRGAAKTRRKPNGLRQASA